MKIKSTVGKWIAVMLCLVLASVAFTACKKDPAPTPEEPTGTGEPSIELIDFFEGDPSGYVIVYPAKAGTTVKNAAKSLAASLNYAYGTSLKCYSDAKVNAAESTKEILVGATNRTESTEAQARCAEDDDFVLQKAGSRLVLVGKSGSGTARAVDHLIDSYIVDKAYTTLMIEPDLNLEWKYREQCAALFTLGSSYSVVYGDRADSAIKTLARELAEEISELTGSEMEAISDYTIGVSINATDYKSDATEVLVGVSNRYEANQGDDLGYMDYEIRLTENKVVLRGGSVESLRRAVLIFQDAVANGDITDLKDASQGQKVIFSETYEKNGIVGNFDDFTPVWASTYTPPAWATDLDEKVVALTSMNARNMSASRGGDSVNYPAYSDLALASAVKAGADVLSLKVQTTKDGVLVVFPAEEMALYTNAEEMMGVNGNPMKTTIGDWTYDQLRTLHFSGTNGENTKILTLYEAVALCKERCFFTVDSLLSENELNGILADLLAEHGAFLSYFKPDPLNNTVMQPLTMDFLAEYKDDYSNAKVAYEVYRQQLFGADGSQLKNRYFRKIFETESPEGETVWQQLRETWRTFLYTDKIVGYCQYITSSFDSAVTTPEAVTSSTQYTIAKEDLAGRVMLFSDPHYYPYNNLLGQETSANDGNKNSAYQFAQMAERIEIITKMIVTEYRGRGLDAVAILGDLSTDNWNDDNAATHTEYYKEFYTKLKDALKKEGITDLPIYALPGNHDSVSNSAWNAVFGTDRQHSFTVGNKLFLMLDTFASNGTGTTGAAYEALDAADMAWIDAQIKANPTKDVIVCSHYLNTNECNTLASKYSQIKGFYYGHCHLHGISQLSNGTYNIDLGCLSYTAFSDVTGSSWDFGYLDLRSLWGYQILEWDQEQTVTYHEFIAHEYYGSNMYYVVPEGGIKTSDLVLSKKNHK